MRAHWRSPLHDLVATRTSRIDPACVVRHAFRQHSGARHKSVVHWIWIAVAEIFDDHEEHGGSIAIPIGRFAFNSAIL
jgi:hypothetical protein